MIGFESEKEKAKRIAKENMNYKIQLELENKSFQKEVQKYTNRKTDCYNQIVAYKAAGNDREAQKVYRQYRRADKALQTYENAIERVENAIVVTDIATAEARLSSIVPKLMNNVDLDNLQFQKAQTNALIEKANNILEPDDTNDSALNAEFAQFYNSIPTGNTSMSGNDQGLADLRTQLEQAKRG